MHPIHHPTLGTQTGRVLPCASINTTLPWIHSIVIPYPSTYPTLPTVGKIPFRTLSIYPNYPSLHFLTLYYCLIKYKAETTYQIRPKRPRTETTQAETTKAETTQG